MDFLRRGLSSLLCASLALGSAGAQALFLGELERLEAHVRRSGDRLTSIRIDVSFELNFAASGARIHHRPAASGATEYASSPCRTITGNRYKCEIPYSDTTEIYFEIVSLGGSSVSVPPRESPPHLLQASTLEIKSGTSIWLWGGLGAALLAVLALTSGGGGGSDKASPSTPED